MVEKIEDPDLRQVFFQLLLVASTFTPPGLEEEQKHLYETLERCGYSLTSSDHAIIDKSSIGDSLVTIAKYSFEYRDSENATRKTVIIDGGLAVQNDRFGDMYICIRARPGYNLPGIDSPHIERSFLAGQIPESYNFFGI